MLKLNARQASRFLVLGTRLRYKPNVDYAGIRSHEQLSDQLGPSGLAIFTGYGFIAGNLLNQSFWYSREHLREIKNRKWKT